MSSFREILYEKLFESFKKSSSDKPLKDIQCKTNDVWRQYKNSPKNDEEIKELVLKRAEEEQRKAIKKKSVFLDYFIKEGSSKKVDVSTKVDGVKLTSKETSSDKRQDEVNKEKEQNSQIDTKHQNVISDGF
ncbi:hypothetical protein AVEN_121117-1 [Araneus ventricosus]|uniref:Uncharacterized protein n=1 Tax=Araneus ventricosus TaxID=182803 RepID=A0A4Y2KU43_ARAVE|nr:hypothetical protein AVEN_121117-1 [Araneus ventricosus]